MTALASHVSGVGYDRGLTVLPTDEPLMVPCPECDEDDPGWLEYPGNGTDEGVTEVAGMAQVRCVCNPDNDVMGDDAATVGTVPLAGPVQLIEPCPDCWPQSRGIEKPRGHSQAETVGPCGTCSDGIKRGSGFVVVAHATAEQVPIVDDYAAGEASLPEGATTYVWSHEDETWLTRGLLLGDARHTDITDQGVFVPGGWAVLLTDIVWLETVAAWTGPTEPGWHTT